MNSLKPTLLTRVLLVLTMFFVFCSPPDHKIKHPNPGDWPAGAKPYTRWWWFAADIQKADIRNQLNWLKKNHFGGVEIAFIYPVNRDPNASRVPWLSDEWTGLVTYSKEYSDSIGLGCDFTFGTLWPFGGTFVADSDRTKVYGDTSFRQPLYLSWTHPDTGNVLDHLSKEAFSRYAAVMGKALGPALKGKKSALFCDSWEVETKKIWTDGFGERFRLVYGYAIEPFMDRIYEPENAGPRYDYMKLVADYVLHHFYIPFHDKCHALNALSRVQCAGSPTDILNAYAAVDIPETEAMLYNPGYSGIVASAAALSGKALVSAETFTCLYGWPADHIREEKTADLKLVADALFANGTNHIIWHGTPFNPERIDTVYFYATVHVGERGSLSADLLRFNQYLEKVAMHMRKGITYSDIAVYIPQEDAWIAGEYPPEKQLPWAWGAYEMRYVQFPDELKGYQPLWINKDFLAKGHVKNQALVLENAVFRALYVDVDHIDPDGLQAILEVAREGLPVCLKKKPLQAGHLPDGEFNKNLLELTGLENVSGDLKKLDLPPPLISGDDLPEFWCRETEDGLLIFLAHPSSKGLTYPLPYGEARDTGTLVLEVELAFRKKKIPVKLTFAPDQSILLSIDENGEIVFHDIVLHLP